MPARLSRRSLLAAAAAVPMAAALGACSGGGTSSGKSGPVRLTFWAAIRGSQQVVDEFNRTHDHIQVEFQQLPGGSQGGYAKLSNAARAGNGPDVVTVDIPQIPGFAIDGILRDITGLVSDELRKALLPQSIELTSLAGRTFAVPLDIEPMVLHYRTDLFAEYGLALPRTWDEFADAARTVRRGSQQRRLVLFATDGANEFSSYSWQAGAQWFGTRTGAWNVSLADAPTRKVAAYWQQLIDEDLVFVNAVDSQQANAQIGQGLVLARLAGAWGAGSQMSAQPGQAGKWRIAPLPQWEPRSPALGTHGGSAFAITKDSENPEAAMEFIAWQASHPDALKARLSSGISSSYPAAPGLFDVGRTAFDRAYYGGQDIFTLFRQEAAKIRPGWVWGPRMTATQRLMQDGFARAGAGQGTLIDAVRAAQAGTMPDLDALGLATTQHSS
ncbi:sugar ABC transporter substrate-binding protein [Amycolatopsis sp. NBC_00345]|uniref:ABC transporter substrate-binding protein n=1 Tax=Amycolatopsis sp. NBC_00345 TaxID=2975955 RepID=UPI002E271745